MNETLLPVMSTLSTGEEFSEGILVVVIFFETAEFLRQTLTISYAHLLSFCTFVESTFSFLS